MDAADRLIAFELSRLTAAGRTNERTARSDGRNTEVREETIGEYTYSGSDAVLPLRTSEATLA